MNAPDGLTRAERIDPMSHAPAISRPAPGNRILLSCIDWQTYSRILKALDERPGLRLTYDRGELEIMSPSMEHDEGGRFLGDLVVLLTRELGLPIKRGGSVTLRRRLRRRGLEPDECFWIANAHRMAGRRRLDLRTDPPPDLAIETDVSRSSLNRLGIYAALGVPEVWRLEADSLTFYVLRPDGGYETVVTSRSFPLVTPADLLGLVQQAREAGDENPIAARFREWIQQRQAAGGPPPAAPPPG
jgi:Uma2 family endonuclease